MSKAITPVSEFSDVTAPTDDQDANEATFEAAIQQLANRTQYNNDNLGGGPALAASQVFGRSSAGAAGGKTATDFAFSVLALAAAVNHADALSTKGSDVASSATTNIAGATGVFVHITGTATITSLGTAGPGVVRFLRFAAAATLTHSANLVLPTAADITTAADDMAIAVSEGSGAWRIVMYQRASGEALGPSDAKSLLGVELDSGVASPDTGALIYYTGSGYAMTNGVVPNGVLLDGDGVAWDLIGNRNIDPYAAIEGTKIDPDFGDQTITTTGDFEFGSAATSPTISQAAVGDAAGETLSILGQGNNSATQKAGDLLLAAGTNAGAGADGDTIIGNGTTAIEITDDGKLGFFLATPVAKPTVSGARNTQAALADLMSDLATLGLCTDSSSLQTAPGTDTSSGGAITFDFSVNRLRSTTLTENVTATLTPPPNIGDLLEVIITQDGTGSRTVSWPGSNIKWAGGTAPTLTTAAGAEDHIYMTWDGTGYVGWALLNVS